MTEPTLPASVGIVALGVAALGPQAGPYAVIVLAALAGGLWALAAEQTAGRRAGAMLLLRLVLTAVVLTGGLAWLLESRYQWPAEQTLAPIALFIGLGSEGRRAILAELRRFRSWWQSTRSGGGQS